MDIKAIKVFIGIDVGKTDHWATALSREGRKVLKSPCPTTGTGYAFSTRSLPPTGT